MKLRTLLVLLALVCVGIPAASAAACSALRGTARSARNDLRHAASEADPVRAKRYAQKADRALSQASREASDCGCDSARRKFRTAGLYARHAKSAKDPQQFASELTRSMRGLDSANRALRLCGRRP